MSSINITYKFLLATLVMGSTLSRAQQLANPESNIPSPAISPAPLTGPYPGLVNLNGTEKRNSVRTWIPDQPTTTVTTSVKHRQVTDYFDGLGRPFQTVNKKAHADGYDIVQQHIYDNTGKESRLYLPHTQQDVSATGEMDYSPRMRMELFYPLSQGDQPYSETLFDNSPLNRPVKQMAPGKAWVGSGRGVQYSYRGNKAEEGIRRWAVSSGSNATPTTPGIYGVNELSVVEVKDEDDKISYVFTDKLGRKIMTRTQNIDPPPSADHQYYASTYYVYNDLNQLRYVITPQATATLVQNNWTNTAAVSELCFRYVYDAKGRMVEKQIPGKEAEYLVYDQRDRLVLTQDGKLRADNKWFFTFYDALNRPTTNGLLELNFTRDQAQTAVSASPTFTYANNLWLYYINGYTLEHAQAYPVTVTNATILSYTYYDNYSQQSGLAFDATKVPAAPSTDLTIVGGTYAKNTLGKITGTNSRVLDPEDPNGNLWINTAFYYNKEGQQLQSVQKNIKGGIDVSSNLYYFQGMPFENTTYHRNPEAERIPGANAALTEIKLDKKCKRNFGFGGNDLVWNLQQTINDGIDYNLAYYDYNHLGAVVVKQFTVANVLQEYNIRGWLKNIEARNPANQDENYFNETLHYNDGFGSKLYNGNIAGITWSYYNQDDNNQKHAYGYSYDKMNRLSHAEYRNNYINLNQWSKTEKDYTASEMNYDHNGNLLTMKQRGNEHNLPVDMDDLTYTYAPNSNKLVKMRDAVAANATPTNPDFKDSADLGVEYTYDANGNMISDANKGISSITYNFLNKPEVITVDGKGTVTYIYDATGNRLQKKVWNSQTSTLELWDYMGNFIYKDNVLQYILNEEGRSRPQAVTSGSTAGQTKFVYDYFIKDHLGNVRSTIGAEPINSLYLARHEIATAGAEQLIFDNIAAVRSDKPGSVNPNDEKAVKLVANDPNKRIGTAIMLQVMPGDKFTFATDAYFESDQTPVNDNTSSEDIITSLVAALTGGTVGGVPVSESGTSTDIINNALGNVNLASQLNDIQDAAFTNQPGPRAGINYLFFDRNMRLIPQISGIIPVGNDPGLFNNVGTPEIATTEPGYVVVYVDNRSVGTDVWFDNVLISHYTGTVQDEEHYYPYGLTVAELHNYAFTDNPYKYNGKELEKSFGLETYEYGARQYDPQIGRWKGVDPYAEKFYSETPFNYAGNNPVKFIDVGGKFKYPANKANEYKNEFPILTQYLSSNIKNDVKKSTRLEEAIIRHAGNSEFGRKELYGEILVWGKESRTVLNFDKEQLGNANTVNSKWINVNWDYAKKVENILGDKDASQSDKESAITAFFITLMDETTLSGTKYRKDPTAVEGGTEGDPGNDLTDEIFYQQDGDEGRLRSYQPDKNDVLQVKNVIDNLKKEDRNDVIPTIPQKK